LEELTSCKKDYLPYPLIKTDCSWCLPGQLTHSLREVSPYGVQFVPQSIIEEFRESGIFTLDMQLLTKVFIRDIYHSFFFPHLWTKKPTVYHLFR